MGYTFKDEQEKIAILRKIIESEFTFSDLEPSYANAAPNTANVYCVFHEHHHQSPSAKFYWDDDKDILILYCFRENRRYTVYDLVDKILCKERNLYKSPEDFCIETLGEKYYNELVQIYKDNIDGLSKSMLEKKQEYIRNLYNKYDNVIDFINCLYLEKE